MCMLTKLLFGESGAHTCERCMLLLTPCYFVPRLTLHVEICIVDTQTLYEVVFDAAKEESLQYKRILCDGCGASDPVSTVFNEETENYAAE